MRKTVYFLFSSLGYGIQDIDRPTAHGDLCNLVSDTFNKEKETVFQLKMGAIDTHIVKANELEMYTDITSEKSGFICEKEGSITNFSCLFVGDGINALTFVCMRQQLYLPYVQICRFVGMS